MVGQAQHQALHFHTLLWSAKQSLTHGLCLPPGHSFMLLPHPLARRCSGWVVGGVDVPSRKNTISTTW